MKNRARFTVYFLALAWLIALFNCTYQETVTNSSGDLLYTALPGDSLLKRGRYFIVFPNDTTLLAGIHSCSTVVNGQLTSTTEDSIFSQTITEEQNQIDLENIAYLVHPQIHKQGQSLEQLKPVAIRYFELTENETLLRGYSIGGPLIPAKDTLVMPHLLSTHLTWTIPLLVSLAEKYYQPTISIHGTALVAKFDPEIEINSSTFRDGLSVKLYYELSGYFLENNSISRVIGAISLNLYFLKDYGLLTQEVLSQIQTVTAHGDTKVKIDRMLLKRDIKNLRPYTEQLIKTE